MVIPSSRRFEKSTNAAVVHQKGIKSDQCQAKNEMVSEQV
jgi:hypothetical protein